MRIACCQYDIGWETKPANYSKVRTMLANAGLPEGCFVALPEMSFTGFSMDSEKIAESVGGASEQFVASLAKEFRLCIGAGVAGQGIDGRRRNQFIAVSPAGDELARYTKQHPFTLGNEHQHYAAGEAATAFEWSGCRIAPFVCYDLRFPELFRIAARQRPHLFVVIANWPEKRISHWTKLLQARAIENQAYVMGVNRCGTDPNLSYCGRSVIIDPLGEPIAEAGDGEKIIAADIDLASVEEYRRNLPFLSDMRV